VGAGQDQGAAAVHERGLNALPLALPDSSALRAAGLKGPALDEALAATFTQAIRAIDRERAKDWERRQVLKVVP
jgi:hypothetical protein